jgi:crossover junction endodeoxyribonuclease RusA
MVDSQRQQMITLDLPYPPSTNKYWRRVGNKTILSRAARQFRKRVADLWFVEKYIFRRDGFGDAPVAVDLTVHPPDRRKRDLDNILKPTLDALQAVRIIDDDSQVKQLALQFAECTDSGKIVVTIVKWNGSNDAHEKSRCGASQAELGPCHESGLTST